jgi:hypothetical protein
MSKIRDITKFLSLTAAENPTNQPLAPTDAALDSAEALALITGGNAITITSGVVNHDDTSSQSSVNNSGSNFIQDITLDTYGHVTAITSAEAGGGGGLGDYGAANSTGTAASATGTDAIAIGEGAAAGGSDGIAIGSGAYAHNQQDNISIGKNTMSGNTGSLNVAIGREAARNSGSANSSVYVGHWSGDGSNGHSSTFIGYAAGNNVDNYGNTAIGYQAMQNNTTGGILNTAVGHKAGFDISSGNWNTCIGTSAGWNITTGNNNVIVGQGAGQALTSGCANTMIGANAGINSTGEYHVMVGFSSEPSTNTTSYEVVVGYNLTGKGQGRGYYGGVNGVYNEANSSTWTTTSDERIKTNITDYTLGLDTLGQVNVKTYNYLSDSAIAAAHPELADSDGLVKERLNTEKTVVGIMAQELEAVLPNSVETRDNGIKSVNKDELFWVMLNSIKELKARVEALENA